MKNWVRKNIFSICSFCLAMSFFVWTDMVSGIFFGEPQHPFDE